MACEKQSCSSCPYNTLGLFSIVDILDRDHTAEVRRNGKGDVIVADVEKRVKCKKESIWKSQKEK